VPFGIDILWDPFAALAVAHATGARFVREVFTGVYASDMGFWSPSAGEVMRYRRAIGAEGVRLLFNINAEFAAPMGSRPLAEVARSVAFSSLPDAICVSGPMTSVPVRAEDLRAVKEAVGSIPVFINTGARHDNIADLLPYADGVIVGSSLKVDGITWNPVDPERVRSFMEIVRSIRQI
jgi:membrane complex biogenesis BtpA family protein